MALTPEDVVNKRFQPTKFREGYDQDEVDDFLDEVVVELRRLNQENEELRQRLTQGGQAPQAAAPAPTVVAAPPVAPPAPPVAPPVAAPAPTYADTTGDTNNLLQLARTLHEQHVREGIEKRDALIAEGQAAAARALQEVEEQQRAQLGGLEQQVQGLEQERRSLEQQIDELRNFERDYRTKLKGYIEGQLRELEAVPVAAAPAPSAPAPAPTPAAPAPDAALVTGPQLFPAPPQQPAYPAPFPSQDEDVTPRQDSGPVPSFGAPQVQPPAPAFGAPPAPQAPQGYPGFGGN